MPSISSTRRIELTVVHADPLCLRFDNGRHVSKASPLQCCQAIVFFDTFLREKTMRVGTRNYAAITAPEGCEKGRGVCYAMLREGDALPQPQSGSVQYRRCTGARQRLVSSG